MAELPPWRHATAAVLEAHELDDMQDFLAQTLREAGPLTLAHFRRGVAVDNKAAGGSYDPVTEADRAAERLLRERIRERFPDHGVLGEEFGYQAGSRGLTWVIDPIDGTRAFITGALHWGMLVALFDGVRPRLGAMFQPYTGELFMGLDGAAWLEHAQQRTTLRSRSCAELHQAVLCCTTPEMFATERSRQAFEALAGEVRLLRYGGDCYSYCMLAMGQVDLVVESSLQAYDIQALIPIIEAAGGGVVCWDGAPAVEGGSVLAYGDACLRDAALRILNRS
jgi:myo-inositol-1(or 4)-monophosphatase